MRETPTYPQLLAALDDVRRRWRFRKILEGALLALAGALVVVLVLVAADNLFQPSPLGRLVLALVLWVSLATALFGLVIRRFLEDRRDDFFAALVEQKHPELHNQLINALQLGRGDQNGFSPRLIQAIVQDAANATADMDMGDCLDARPLLWSGAGAGVAGVLLLGYAVVFLPRFVNGLERMLAPLAAIPPYTATQVTVRHDKDRVPEGVPVTLEAHVTGAVPSRAHLYCQTADGHWQKPTELEPAGADSTVFRYTVLQASESFNYYVSAGDGRSQQYHVEVVKRPQVENLTLTYVPPPYIHQPPRQVPSADGEISGLAGTTVQVELKATKPLQKAAFTVQGGDAVVLARGADERTWVGSFVVWSDKAKLVDGIGGQLLTAPARYQIKLLDTDGFENADPLWRSIALSRDQVPSVALVAPGRDLQVQPGSKVELAVETRDDYGLDDVRILYRVNDSQEVRELRRFPHPGLQESSDRFTWDLGTGGLKAGDLVQYWAKATDQNTITGPGEAESRRFTIFLTTPEQVSEKLDLKVSDYVAALEELVRLQRQNRAETNSGVAFVPLIARQGEIRTKTQGLARAMEKDALPVQTMVKELDELFAGPMADVVKLLEQGRDLDKTNAAQAAAQRNQSLPVQDRIIAALEALLARLQRNEAAKEALRKIEKKDKPAYQALTKALGDTVKDLDTMLKEQAELAQKFEKLPKKPGEDFKDDKLQAMKDLEAFAQRSEQWAKGKVNELTKLPTGFVDDFKMRKDVNRIFEEIEKQANRAKAEKAEVSLEDLGAGLATKMKEDLEMWMPDSPDNIKWVLEEPLNKKPMKIPEMPLPKALEDMIGDLLQKADEFDKDADDVTSAWGDNLDQAGWGVSDGPISTFSAKGKTGNDMPNNMELSGRSGDGRRGKSSGQMVGDTARALQGRKTPARVTNERYEPGQLKQEGRQDPNGATGGGKKAGAGRQGLQGGAPPDMVKDMGRLSAKEAALRQRAEQVAQKLDTMGIQNKRLTESIELMKSVEKDLQDQRYEDAARKRREALSKLHAAFDGLDETTAAQLSKARDLPPQLRQELLQSSDEGYPPGYEALLKSYFEALSKGEK